MQKLNIPFNLSILAVTPDKLKNVKQIKALDAFDGGTMSNFHPEGLFSTDIFGRVGDERRSLLFGYIDIKATIFHPLIFGAIVKLKRFYGDIMSSRAWALWDESEQDFIAGKPSDGARTGFSFFLEHWEKINYRETKSNIRSEYIQLVTKNKAIALTSNIIVMPAGLRDMEIDELGRKSEDEVNNLYRRFISISNVIVDSSIKINPEIIDKPRYEMQLNFVALYDMIEAMIAGKKKLFLSKVASRRIFNGTRNVATAMNTSVSILGKKGAPNFNSTILGLYQYMQATLPVSTVAVLRFLSAMFPDVNSPATLVDPKTLQRKELFLHVKYYDKWATTEGVEKIIASFKEETLRTTPLSIDGYYLGLLYLGPDSTFKVLGDIRELPANRLKEHVRPLTLMDILYLSVYRSASKYPVYVTRYPITGVGSIYPSMVHLRVTNEFEERRPLDSNWAPESDDAIAYEFPIIGSSFVNAMSSHPSHAKALGLDYDGDTTSANCAYSDEAIEEAKRFFTLRKAYIGNNGKLLYSTSMDTVERVLHSLTGDPVVAATESLSLMDSLRDGLETYQEAEGDSFTHHGVRYDINDVFDMAEAIKPIKVKLASLVGNVKNTNELDPKRVAQADVSVPIIAIREEGRIYVLDGNHRLYKLYHDQATSIYVKFINQDILDIARMDD